MEFDFWQNLVGDAEVDEVAASRYIEELSHQFAESPEGSALVKQGIQPGHYVYVFLDHALRYIRISPAEMDTGDIRETLDVIAEKFTAPPGNLDRAIPELEAFCDFLGRAFAFEKASAWKRAIQDEAPYFRTAIRDPQQWGMAKSMMMEGAARGFDLSTEEGINLWFLTKQAEQIARAEAKEGLSPGESLPIEERLQRLIGLDAAADEAGSEDEYGGLERTLYLSGGEPDTVLYGRGTPSKRRRNKEKSRRKQAKASRRQNRR